MSREPRIPPIDPGDAPEDVAAILAAKPGGLNLSLGENKIFATLARHPDLFKAWLPFGGYLLRAGTLPARDRELLILRTGANCRCSYEWGQHVLIAGQVGIGRDEIERVLDGPEADGWAEHDAALLRAADELHASADLSDATWSQLQQTYDDAQMIEAVMLVGQYRMVANTLNSLRVELDPWLEALPGA